MGYILTISIKNYESLKNIDKKYEILNCCKLKDNRYCICVVINKFLIKMLGEKYIDEIKNMINFKKNEHKLTEKERKKTIFEKIF